MEELKRVLAVNAFKDYFEREGSLFAVRLLNSTLGYHELYKLTPDNAGQVIVQDFKRSRTTTCSYPTAAGIVRDGRWPKVKRNQ